MPRYIVKARQYEIDEEGRATGSDVLETIDGTRNLDEAIETADTAKGDVRITLITVVPGRGEIRRDFGPTSGKPDRWLGLRVAAIAWTMRENGERDEKKIGRAKQKEREAALDFAAEMENVPLEEVARGDAQISPAQVANVLGTKAMTVRQIAGALDCEPSDLANVLDRSNGFEAKRGWWRATDPQPTGQDALETAEA